VSLLEIKFEVNFLAENAERMMRVFRYENMKMKD